MKCEKREIMKEIELKENYSKLGLLEAVTIKQVEMNEKNKRLHQTSEKLLETKLCSRNLIKKINTWATPPRTILGTNLKMAERKTQTNGPEDKKGDDSAQCLICETWHKQIMCQEL